MSFWIQNNLKVYWASVPLIAPAQLCISLISISLSTHSELIFGFNEAKNTTAQNSESWAWRHSPTFNKTKQNTTTKTLTISDRT